MTAHKKVHPQKELLQVEKEFILALKPTADPVEETLHGGLDVGEDTVGGLLNFLDFLNIIHQTVELTLSLIHI